MEIYIQNQRFELEISERKFLKERVVLTTNKIVIFLSEDRVLAPKVILNSWLKSYSKRLILKRVQELAALHNFTYNRVSIREQSTRWGSCSSEKNLNFNWKLILAPPEILDYVIIHELAHTVELNHSKAFWNVVEQAMPNYKECRIWLRKNGDSLAID